MNILFLCTANMHRSRTAEDYFKKQHPDFEFKSAGLSEKYCKQYGSTLCTVDLLNWADKIFVMEPMHVDRISEYAGKQYLQKVEVLNIEDVYKYMQPELINRFSHLIINERNNEYF